MAVKRKRIGVFIGNANSFHTQDMLRGICDSVIDRDIEVVVFPGYQVDYCFTNGSEMEQDYRYMVDVMRDYVDRTKIDAMIICFCSHTMFMGMEDKKYLLDKYIDVPYVLLEEYSDRSKSGYIICDNYNGMRKIVEHLVQFHGYRRFVYLGGLDNNRDSMDRQRAFVDVLKENNIEVTDTMIRNGQFTDMCHEQINYLLDNNPDIEAFVCASDLMAYTVYDVCRERGITVGNPRLGKNTIAVTGFDDTKRSVMMDPPLTTVSQDFYSAGKDAIKLANEIMSDGCVEGGVIPINTKVRSSCGCGYIKKQRFMPITDAERTNPEFYAIKVAEIIREEILSTEVKESVGDYAFDIIYDAIFHDVMIVQGFTQETLTPYTVVNQLRELLSGELGKYISINALFGTFSDYMSSLIHSSRDHMTMILLSDILLEGMNFLQGYSSRFLDEMNTQVEKRGWQSSLIARNMILADDSLEGMLYAALNRLEISDDSDLYIYLYDEPVKHEKGIEWTGGRSLSLAAYKSKADGIVTLNDSSRVKITDDLLEPVKKDMDSDNQHYAVANIYHGDYSYGILVSRFETDDVLFVSMAGMQMGIALNEYYF